MKKKDTWTKSIFKIRASRIRKMVWGIVWDARANDKGQHNFWTCIDLAKLQLYFLEFSPLRKSRLAWAKRDILQETFRKQLWSSSQTLFSLDKKCCPLLCKPDSMSNQRNIIWLISNHFAPVVHTQCKGILDEKKRTTNQTGEMLSSFLENCYAHPLPGLLLKSSVSVLISPSGIYTLQSMNKEFSSKGKHIFFPDCACY